MSSTTSSTTELTEAELTEAAEPIEPIEPIELTGLAGLQARLGVLGNTPGSINTSGLTREQGKWYDIIRELEQEFRDDINSLGENLSLEKAKGAWLDTIGTFLAVKRSYREINKESNDESNGGTTSKETTLEDSSYRTNLKVRLSSVYDDFTYHIFEEVYTNFLGENRMTVHVFDDLIQFSFHDVSEDEIKNIEENKFVLGNFSAGRSKMKITYSTAETLRLGRTIYKEDDTRKSRLSTQLFYGAIID